jgi:hypothetical protein
LVVDSSQNTETSNTARHAPRIGTAFWQNYLHLGSPEVRSVVFFAIPAFTPLAWTTLYAGSGFLLKFARRFDIGFRWFNRRFDIEKKPLQSIGLVAVRWLRWCIGRR